MEEVEDTNTPTENPIPEIEPEAELELDFWTHLLLAREMGNLTICRTVLYTISLNIRMLVKTGTDCRCLHQEYYRCH